MLHFIDFEVFRHDWLCVIANAMDNTKTAIVNDREALTEYYEKHSHEIFVGYNIRGYDQHIMKAIIAGADPYEISKLIIDQKVRGFKLTDAITEGSGSTRPLAKPLIFDVKTSQHSLKVLEGYIGKSITETPVSFNTRRKLTPEEIEKVKRYCLADVMASIDVFMEREGDFLTHIALIKEFGVPIENIGKTKAQLVAVILESKKTPIENEWNIEVVNTLRLSKYNHVKEWFLNKGNQAYSNKLTCTVAGVEHTFGWGGLHGAKQGINRKGDLYIIDGEGFYPSIMIKYDLLSKAIPNKKRYAEIEQKRTQYKKEGSHLDLPYKEVLTSAFGICKDKYSTAYDPCTANNLCINGQLLILDLIEKLESINSFELIQTNTDGIIVKINQKDKEKMATICREWESRTGIRLTTEKAKEIWQKGVNDYILEKEDGTFDRRGQWAKEKNKLDNDMEIINEALFNYYAKGIEPEITISGCSDLLKFQRVVSISKRYARAYHGDNPIEGKTHRVFASTDPGDKDIRKQKKNSERTEKFENTPPSCFILNGDIRGAEIPRKLDKEYYVNEAWRRINLFIKSEKKGGGAV